MDDPLLHIFNISPCHGKVMQHQVHIHFLPNHVFLQFFYTLHFIKNKHGQNHLFLKSWQALQIMKIVPYCTDIQNIIAMPSFNFCTARTETFEQDWHENLSFDCCVRVQTGNCLKLSRDDTQYGIDDYKITDRRIRPSTYCDTCKTCHG